MSKKRWFAIVAAFALMVGVAFAVVALVPPTPGVTYANFSRIQKGMTRDEVVAILGRPNLLSNKDTMAWRNDNEDEIEVDVDRAGRVTSLSWNELVDDRTVWEKLRDRVPLLARPPLALRLREVQ